MRTAPFASLKSLFAISDEQAMWRVQNGDDAQAFGLLVDRWRTPLVRLAWRMLGDASFAEDIAQEVFARVFLRRQEFRTDARFSTWAWRIALNLCYDELRRRERRGTFALRGAVEDDDTESTEGRMDPGLSPDAQAVERESGELVRTALQQLPQPLRAVLVLRHYENLKFVEIAEVMDIPEGTVKSRMAEALSRMHRLLNPLWKACENERPA